MRRFLSVIFGCLILTSCTGYNSKALGPAVYEIQDMPVEEARIHLAGKTIMTYVESFRWCQANRYGPNYCKTVAGPGTQVEYLAQDGRLFLWAPGVTKLSVGNWELRRWYDQYEICFDSQSIVKNVLALKPYDDGFRCALLSDYVAHITETQDADAFDLVSGQMPFRLGNGPTTIDNLLRWGQTSNLPEASGQ